MKKIIFILVIVGVSVFGYSLFKDNQLQNKVIKANVEIICYQETNRLSVPTMIADKKTKEEIGDGVKMITAKQDEVAKKYGYQSFKEFAILGAKKFNNKTQNKIEAEIIKKVKETCAPGYISY